MFENIAGSNAVRIAILVILFAGVCALSFSLVNVGLVRRSARRRLETGGGDVPIEGMIPAGSLRANENEGAWARLVERIEKSGLSLADTKDQSLKQRLAAAGFTSPTAPRVYTLVRLGLVMLLPTLWLLFRWLSPDRPGMVGLYIQCMIAALAGLYLPSLVVSAKADRRQQAIINGFPDALDLMLVCVEAGLGLEAAFARVGQEMTNTHPLIAQQLGNVVLELRAGRSREDALRRMADRAQADEVRAFATLLIQSTKLGSSVAQTLRVYAAEMREKRRLRAEEKAHRLPVLLSVPLVACMLPVMIGVLMLPAVIRVMRSIVPALGGD
ncbi:type II secretion system F family protein [Sphingomonas sp. LHG3406-1]|uniref:type II secretion system F family protein n=1 Tax=Sphingomonas sp. LHG3406-1 TaxID=2804617 RepID=UPI00262ED7BD|nr:type II secretion system F family protein [Sphingomonas sp. LHG3406-1]